MAAPVDSAAAVAPRWANGSAAGAACDGVPPAAAVFLPPRPPPRGIRGGSLGEREGTRRRFPVEIRCATHSARQAGAATDLDGPPLQPSGGKRRGVRQHPQLPSLTPSRLRRARHTAHAPNTLTTRGAVLPASPTPPSVPARVPAEDLPSSPPPRPPPPSNEPNTAPALPVQRIWVARVPVPGPVPPQVLVPR